MIFQQTTKELLAESLKDLSNAKSVDKVTIKVLAKNLGLTDGNYLRGRKFLRQPFEERRLDKDSARAQRIVVRNFFLHKIFRSQKRIKILTEDVHLAFPLFKATMKTLPKHALQFSARCANINAALYKVLGG